MRSGSAAAASRSRTRGWRTATGPMPVITSRSGQMAMPHDAPVTVLGLEVGMRAEKIGDLGLDCLSEQGACPIAQNIGELVVERPWLNQSDDGIVGHGISLL